MSDEAAVLVGPAKAQVSLRSRLGTCGAVLGDSLPSGGATSTTYGMAYPLWAQALSMGRIQIAEFQGFPGKRTDEIAALGLQNVITNPNVGWCLVGGGTNDFIQGLDWKVARDRYLNLLVVPLLAAGITPVLTTLPPTNTSGTQRSSTLQFNAWVRRYASANRLPLIDPYGLLVDPANQQYKTAYYLDGIHPNDLGYYDWGVLMWNTLSSLLPLNSPVTAGNTDAVNLLSGNAMFLTDAGADGIPDTWTAGGSATGITHSLVAADNGVAGNWAQIAAVASAGDRTLAFSAPGSRVIPGNRMAVCGFVETANFTAGNGLTVQVSFSGTTGTTVYPVFRWRRNARGFFYMEVVVPAGATGMTMTLIAHQGTVTAKFAQATIIDLTALLAAA